MVDKKLIMVDKKCIFQIRLGGSLLMNVSNMYQVGMIPAQTQLQTALSISLGSEGKAVSCHIFLVSSS